MAKQPLTIAELQIQPFTALGADGVLLVCGDTPDHANPMTISWGMFGIMWGKPIMMAMVRHSRYTWDFINTMPDFTVNWMPEDWSDALLICGTESGRDKNKFAETGMTPVAGTVVQSPIIAESALSLECRTLYRTDLQREQFIDPSVLSGCYGDGDMHGLFFGEVVAVSGVEHFRLP